jgi:hypothetical protein
LQAATARSNASADLCEKCAALESLRQHSKDQIGRLRSLYPSKEVRDQVIASGMEGGMRESYRRLTEIIARLG